MAIQGISALKLDSKFALNADGSNAMRVVTRDSDSAQFSDAAKNLAIKGDGINGTRATANGALGNKKAEYNFANGQLTVGSTTLDLKGFINSATADFTVQEGGANGGAFTVISGGKSVEVNSSGKMLMTKGTAAVPPTLDADGKETAPGIPAVPPKLDIGNAALDTAKQSIHVNNSGGSVSAGGNGDTVFARSASTNVSGGARNDRIFAYGGVAGTMTGGAGDDALYTSKISGTVNMDGGDSYVRAKSATGGTINLGGEAGAAATLDMTSGTLGAVKVTGSAESMNVAAKSAVGTNIDLSAAKHAAIDIVGGIGSNTTIKMGSVSNSLVAGSISGSGIKISANGEMTASILGGVSGLEVTGSDKVTSGDVHQGRDSWQIKGGVANSTFNMGEGDNSFSAGGAVTKSSINAKADSSSAIKAASFTGGDASTMNLGGGGNIVDFKGGVSKVNIEMGSGANTFSAGSLSKVNMTAAEAAAGLNAGKTTIDILGAAAEFNYTGNNGEDEMNIKGGVTKSNLNFGSGALTMNVSGAMSGSSILRAESSANADVSLNSFTGLGGTSGVSLLGAGANTLNVKGTFSAGTIDLGSAGANTLTAGKLGGTAKSGVVINMGGTASTDTQKVNVSGAVSYTTYNGGAGEDSLQFKGNLSNSTINLGSGSNTLDMTNGTKARYNISNSTITAESGATSTTKILAGSFTGKAGGSAGITLGGGGNTVDFTGNVGGATLDLGTGANSFSAKAITGGKAAGAGVTLNMGVGGSSDQNVKISGAANYFTYNGSKGDDMVEILGNLSNSNVDLGEGTNTLNMRGKVNGKGAERSFNITNTNISSTGAGTATTIIAGGFAGKKDHLASINLGGGTNNVDLSGTLSMARVEMGSGSNTLSAKSIVGAKDANVTTINMGTAGSGTNTVNVSGAANFVSFAGGSGSDTLNIKGNLSNSSIDLGSGANSLDMSSTVNGKTKTFNISNTNITATGAATGTTINAGSFTGKKGAMASINLGGGTNLVNLSGAINMANIEMGTGSNTLNAKSISGDKTNGTTINMGTAGASDNTVNVSGAVSNMHFSGGSGADTLNIKGALSNAGIDLGSGANTLDMSTKLANGKTKTFNISNTNINTADGTSSATITAGSFTGKKGALASINLGSGDNTLNLSGTLGMATVNMGTGSNTLSAKSISGAKDANTTINMGTAGESTNTLNVSGAVTSVTYNGGSGADTVNIKGTLSKSTINLGSGANTLDMSDTVNGKTKLFNISSSTISSYSDTTSGANASSTSITAGAVTGTANARSSISLGGADNQVVNVKSLAKTDFTVAGGLDMTLDSLSGMTLNLGSGSNTINVKKNIGGATEATAVTINATSGAADSTQNINVSGSANKFTYKGAVGDDTLSFGGNISNSTIDLGSGANSVSTSNAKTNSGILAGSSITSDSGSNTITLNGTGLGAKSARSSISLGGTGSSTINITTMKGLDIDLGDSIANVSAGVVGGTGTSKVDIKGSAGSTLNFTGGATTNLSMDMSLAANATNINLASLTGGDIKLGSGGNTFAVTGDAKKGAAKTATLTIDLGSGGTSTFSAKNIDGATITSTGTAGANILAETAKGMVANIGGAADITVTNSITGGTLSAGGNMSVDTKLLTGKATVNGSTAAGSLTISAGTIENSTISNGSGATTIKSQDGKGLSIANSTFTLGGANTFGTSNTDAVTMKGVNVTATGTDGTTIHAATIVGSAKTKTSAAAKSVLDLGAGNNTVNVYGELTADITLGSGANTIGNTGTDGTTFKGGNITVGSSKGTAGATTIQGKGMEGTNISANVSGNFKVDMGTGDITKSTIAQSGVPTPGPNKNTIIAKNVTNSTFNLGDGENDLSGITDTISNSNITFGKGKNVIGAASNSKLKISGTDISSGAGLGTTINAEELTGAKDKYAQITLGAGTGATSINNLNITKKIDYANITLSGGNTDAADLIGTLTTVVSNSQINGATGSSTTFKAKSMENTDLTMKGKGNSATVDGNITGGELNLGNGATATLTANGDITDAIISGGAATTTVNVGANGDKNIKGGSVSLTGKNNTFNAGDVDGTTVTMKSTDAASVNQSTIKGSLKGGATLEQTGNENTANVTGDVTGEGTRLAQSGKTNLANITGGILDGASVSQKGGDGDSTNTLKAKNISNATVKQESYNNSKKADNKLYLSDTASAMDNATVTMNAGAAGTNILNATSIGADAASKTGGGENATISGSTINMTGSNLAILGKMTGAENVLSMTGNGTGNELYAMEGSGTISVVGAASNGAKVNVGKMSDGTMTVAGGASGQTNDVKLGTLAANATLTMSGGLGTTAAEVANILDGATINMNAQKATDTLKTNNENLNAGERDFDTLKGTVAETVKGNTTISGVNGAFVAKTDAETIIKNAGSYDGGVTAAGTYPTGAKLTIDENLNAASGKRT